MAWAVGVFWKRKIEITVNLKTQEIKVFTPRSSSASKPPNPIQSARSFYRVPEGCAGGKKSQNYINLKIQLLICWLSVFVNCREAGHYSSVNAGSITSSCLQVSIRMTAIHWVHSVPNIQYTVPEMLLFIFLKAFESHKCNSIGVSRVTPSPHKSTLIWAVWRKTSCTGCREQQEITPVTPTLISYYST